MERPCAIGNHQWRAYKSSTTGWTGLEAEYVGWRCCNCQHTKDVLETDEAVQRRYDVILRRPLCRPHP